MKSQFVCLMFRLDAVVCVEAELPNETQMMKTVILAVANGSRNPTALNSKLHELKPKLTVSGIVIHSQKLRGNPYAEIVDAALSIGTGNGMMLRSKLVHQCSVNEIF